MTKSPVHGKVAAVTGGGSGIGRALAIELTERGATVSTCDVDEVGLKETAARCGGELHTAVVDVADRSAVRTWAEEVADRSGVVHQVYNNAGIAYSESVLDSDWADYERVLAVNLNGVIHGTQAFLPHLVASGDGHVVNVSSLNGYFAQPNMSHYCTSKFAVRGFTESLRTEMLLEGHPVQVSVVHPGGIATNISDNALALARKAGHEITAAHEARTRTYREKLLRMDPRRAAGSSSTASSTEGRASGSATTRCCSTGSCGWRRRRRTGSPLPSSAGYGAARARSGPSAAVLPPAALSTSRGPA